MMVLKQGQGVIVHTRRNFKPIYKTSSPQDWYVRTCTCNSTVSDQERRGSVNGWLELQTLFCCHTSFAQEKHPSYPRSLTSTFCVE